METTKIEHLTHTGTDQGKDGTTYHRFDCILENGLVGEVSAQTMTRWAVGEEVVVKSHKHTKYGVRLSLDKAGYATQKQQQPRQAQGHNVERQESIVTQWAIREAQQYLFHGTTAPDKVTLYDIWGVAKHLKSMHDNFDTWGGIYKEQTSQRAQAVSTENIPPVDAPAHGDKDLPF
jgi:hypothetical protein